MDTRDVPALSRKLSRLWVQPIRARDTLFAPWTILPASLTHLWRSLCLAMLFFPQLLFCMCRFLSAEMHAFGSCVLMFESFPSPVHFPVFLVCTCLYHLLFHLSSREIAVLSLSMLTQYRVCSSNPTECVMTVVRLHRRKPENRTKTCC